MEQLSKIFTSALRACTERGMKLPFVLCAASRNGSILAMRVIGDGQSPDVLAEHYEGAGFALPVSIMIIDQAGDAIRVVILLDGSTSLH